MSLRYQSGEEIRAGDRVLFHGESGEIEFVVDPANAAPDDWYLQEYGGGVMIEEPKVFGSAFVPAEQLPKTEDLEFVARADAAKHD